MRLVSCLFSPLMGRSIRSVGGYVDVRLFLESIECGDVAKNFSRIEDLLQMKSLDLRKMGIPPKQRKRILRHAEYLRHGIVPYEYAIKYNEQQGGSLEKNESQSIEP
eukprot:jgi/Galph1/3240/GphlegSOOS_G1896.1